MKTGQIFWGVLFLSVGSLILLHRYDVIDMDWYFVWDLWPVLIILWGLAIITKNTIVKPIIIVISALIIGSIVYGTVANIVHDVESDVYWDDEDYNTHKFIEDYKPEISYAELELSGGAGSFSIEDRTSYLIKGYARGNFSKYDFHTYDRDDKSYISIDLDKKGWSPFRKESRNFLELQLNDSPVWDFNFNIGAAKSNFDLSLFKVAKLELNTGATKTEIKFGDRYNDTEVKIQMGAAALDLLIPLDSGCRLKGDMALVVKNFEGFKKFDNGYYETENYADSENKIEIEVSGGVSSISINRY